MIFSGYLDTATLGNAGFAEQRTSGDISLDLSDYDGLELDIEKSDGLAYTLTLRDELPSKGADGKEQSSVSWDFDFRPQEGGEVLFMRWKDLKPNYKGKEKKDAKPVKRSKIKRIGIKIRRYDSLLCILPSHFHPLNTLCNKHDYNEADMAG